MQVDPEILKVGAVTVICLTVLSLAAQIVGRLRAAKPPPSTAGTLRSIFTIFLATLIALLIFSGLYAGIEWLQSGEQPPPRYTLLLRFLLLVAIAIFVHTAAMVVAGKGLHEPLDSVRFGMGPKLFGTTGSDGVEYEVRALPIGGSAKFSNISDLGMILISFAALTSLVIVAIVVASTTFTLSAMLATLRDAFGGLIALDMRPAAGRLLDFFQSNSLPTVVAGVFAGVAALNALPLPALNGGAIIIGAVNLITGKRNLTESAAMGPLTLLTVVLMLILFILMALALLSDEATGLFTQMKSLAISPAD